MENALRACCKGIKIGKILIHGEGNDGPEVCGNNLNSTPLSVLLSLLFILAAMRFLMSLTLLQLIYEKLPADIASHHVLLLEPVLASGLIQMIINSFYE